MIWLLVGIWLVLFTTKLHLERKMVKEIKEQKQVIDMQQAMINTLLKQVRSTEQGIITQSLN